MGRALFRPSLGVPPCRHHRQRAACSAPEVPAISVHAYQLDFCLNVNLGLADRREHLKAPWVGASG